VNSQKLWYIPGWASPRDGDCLLLRELRAGFAVDVIWPPDYGREPDGQSSFRDIYAEGIARRLEREPSPPIVIGWSLGGMVAMELAAMLPSQVKALVLFSTTARFCSDAARSFGPTSDEVTAMRDNLDANTLRRFFAGCAFPSRCSRDELEARIEHALEASEDALRLGLTYLLRADLRAFVPDLKTPILVAHGDRDAVVPAQAAIELTGLARTIAPRMLPGAGHMLPDTHSGEIRDLIAGLCG
jgi:pimeloyl-[acyl-carrier protein] methyl ester esterase